MEHIKLITENNDYIIELYKVKSIFSNREICKLSFKTILDIEILTINITLMEISKIIDNMVMFGEIGQDIFCYLDIDNSSLKSYILGLSVKHSYDKFGQSFTEDYITMYSNINNQTKPILSFEVTGSLSYIYEIFYDIYIDDLPEDEKKEILNL